MKKVIYVIALVAVMGCLNYSFAETVDGTTYEYTRPVLTADSSNNQTHSSVQLYSANTPDANRTKAIRENQELLATEPNEVSQLPTLDNYAQRQGTLLNQVKKYDYEVSPEVLSKIDKLDTRLNEMNKMLLAELKKMNERVEKLNKEVQNANIKEVNKKSPERTLPLSKSIQQAFAESSTMDLKDIPTAVH